MKYKYKKWMFYTLGMVVFYLVFSLGIMYITYPILSSEMWLGINFVSIMGDAYIGFLLVTVFMWPVGIKTFNNYLYGKKLMKFQKNSEVYRKFIELQSTREGAEKLRKMVKLQNIGLALIPHGFLVLVLIFSVALLTGLAGVTVKLTGFMIVHIIINSVILCIVCYLYIKYFLTFLKEVSILWNENLWNEWCETKFK